jgi:PAS domain S-box-containing protein
MADSLDPPEAALMMDRLLASTVLDGLPDAILITDTVGVVEYVNRAALRLLGVAHAGARGRPVHEILKLHDGATDQPIVAPLTFLLSMSGADALASGSYAQLLRRDGTKLPIDCSITTIHASRNTPAALVLTLRDASRAHARIEQLLKVGICHDK